MIENKFLNHDPDFRHNLDDVNEPIESDGLTAEQKEDRVGFLQNLKSIKIYKTDGEPGAEPEIDIEKTKAERERFIEEKGLEETDLYTNKFKIGTDENGLPIMQLKE